MKGRLIFFSAKYSPFNPAHVAIQVAINSVIDINCGSSTKHTDDANRLLVGKHDLSPMFKDFEAYEFKSPKELQDLDGE